MNIATPLSNHITTSAFGTWSYLRDTTERAELCNSECRVCRTGAELIISLYNTYTYGEWVSAESLPNLCRTPKQFGTSSAYGCFSSCRTKQVKYFLWRIRATLARACTYISIGANSDRAESAAFRVVIDGGKANKAACDRTSSSKCNAAVAAVTPHIQQSSTTLRTNYSLSLLTHRMTAWVSDVLKEHLVLFPTKTEPPKYLCSRQIVLSLAHFYSLWGEWVGAGGRRSAARTAIELLTARLINYAREAPKILKITYTNFSTN